MKQFRNYENDHSIGIFTAQQSQLDNTLLDWQFSKYAAAALEHARGDEISNAGGVRPYLLERGGLSETEIKSFKGNVAEYYRNANEQGSSVENDPRHEYADRLVDGKIVQDYAGNSLFELASKLDTDGAADRIQVTDALYQKMLQRIEDGGIYSELFKENLSRIEPDSEHTHESTSSEFYEHKTQAGIDRIEHPVKYAVLDSAEHEIFALASFGVISLASELSSKGSLEKESFERLINRAPSFMLRYTSIGAASLSLTELLSDSSDLIADNTDIVAPGVGFVLAFTWNGVRYMRGDISKRQFFYTSKISAGGTALAVGTKLAVGYAFDPTAGVVTTCVICVSVAYAATVGYLSTKKNAEIIYGRLEKSLKYLGDNLLTSPV